MSGTSKPIKSPRKSFSRKSSSRKSSMKTPISKGAAVPGYTGVGGGPSEQFTWDKTIKGRTPIQDLPAVHHALMLFMEGKMLECEAFIRDCDPKRERLYFTTAIAIIGGMKGLMSFEDKDVETAINSVRHGNNIAQDLREEQSLPSKLAGMVLGEGIAVDHVKSMTDVGRHAELVYAENLLEKAVLGIVYSGDWFQLIKEALNMRTATGIYRTLHAFLQTPEGAAADPHFKSGVQFGMGNTYLVLSMLPSRVMGVMEWLGYSGDRTEALTLLMEPGGWSKDPSKEPTSVEDEGIRRPICDIALLIFHLVLRSFTVEGIDTDLAERILEFNLKRFPNGVFFLFGAGRIAFCRSQPLRATRAYEKALKSQDQYPQLHYLAYWELAVCAMSRWRLEDAMPHWRILREQASWSKACYAYGAATSLLQIGGPAEKEEAIKTLEAIPNLLNKIGGKSIPVEKFVARKARKFSQQGNRLVIPGVEFAYVLGAIDHATAKTLRGRIGPVVKRAKELAEGEEKPVWDDVATTNFLYAIVMRYIAYPDADAKPDDEDDDAEERDDALTLTKEEAAKAARAAFERLIEIGPQVQSEHWLLYFGRYEFAQFLTCEGELEKARSFLELVASEKHLEGPSYPRSGKYNMENVLVMKVHAASGALEKQIAAAAPVSKAE